MEKQTLTDADRALVETAVAALHAVHRAEWHRVGAALRTRSGRVITGVELRADVGSLSVCAEPIVLGKLVEDDEHDQPEVIVAVYRPRGAGPGETRVFSPCGRCRELILDYAPDASVILREPGTDFLFKTPARELLPYKCEGYRVDGDFI